MLRRPVQGLSTGQSGLAYAVASQTWRWLFSSRLGFVSADARKVLARSVLTSDFRKTLCKIAGRVSCDAELLFRGKLVVLGAELLCRGKLGYKKAFFA